MKQKNQCLGILICLGFFTGLRAFWTTFPLVLGLDTVSRAVSIYNLILAIGIWYVVWLLRQVPVSTNTPQTS
jgi:hypothetical protein